MSADLHYLSLDEVARRLKARKLTSVEMTEAILDRAKSLDPRLKSYATLTPERALAEARKLDAEAAAGKSRGPLHGVPIAVKDLCNTEGVATAAGMAIHRRNVPDKDATVVRRLKEAGAVILGKLQMTEGAFGAHHPSIDPPVNPFHAAYWTGVSSSGSGVATAAGLCFGSLGSDTGGSIRFPSTMNGLSGLKPTWGRVSRAGVFALADSLDHIGPMARSALDAAIMLGVIAGADSDDPTASPQPVPDYVGSIGGGVTGLRVGVVRQVAGADDDVTRVQTHVEEVFARLGATIVKLDLPANFDTGSRDWVAQCAVETALAHSDTYPSRAAEYGPVLAGLIDAGHKISAVEYARLQVRRAALTGSLNSLLAGLDLLILPVMPNATWKVATLAAAGRDPEMVASRLRYTAPLDLSGHPSLTLPGGMNSDGVPVGFQIVGGVFTEARILAAGHGFQQVTDWHLRRPPV